MLLIIIRDGRMRDAVILCTAMLEHLTSAEGAVCDNYRDTTIRANDNDYSFDLLLSSNNNIPAAKASRV